MDGKELADQGAGNASERSQQAKQDSLTQEHRSLAGHRATVQLWWVQRCGLLAASAHIWPLPDKRQTPAQLREPNSQVKETQAVSRTPVSLSPLRSPMKIYSPGCPACLEHSSGGPTSWYCFLSIYRQISLLPPYSF